jgi:hypothetical protein
VRRWHPESRTSAASNFLIKASRVRTRRMAVRMDDLLHTISISVICASRWLSLNYELALTSSVSRRESTSSGRLQHSFHIWFWKENLKLWSNTESRPEGLLKRPDGCKLEQLEASRYRGSSGRESTSSGTVGHVVWTAEALDSWASWRDDTSSRRLTGNRIF